MADHEEMLACHRHRKLPWKSLHSLDFPDRRDQVSRSNIRGLVLVVSKNNQPTSFRIDLGFCLSNHFERRDKQDECILAGDFF